MKNFLRNYSPAILSCLGFVLICLGQPAGLMLFFAGVLMAGKQQAALFVFPTNCAGRLIDVSNSRDGSLSLANVRPWTTQDLEDNSLKEVGYDVEYNRLQEARLADYKESTMSELVNSRVTNIKNLVQHRPGPSRNKSIVFPWIQMTQRHNVNIQYWKVNSGTPNATAGTGSMHPGAWDLVIGNQTGEFKSTLPNIYHYFLPGRMLFVDYASAADNLAHPLQYTIVASSPIGDGSTATVTVAPNISPTGWANLSAAAKLLFQIGGLAGGNADTGTGAYIGANSISDWESYREQDRAINNVSILHFPIQTSRSVWSYTEDWLNIMNNALQGTFFKKYWQLDVAQQRRQLEDLYQKTILNSVMWGQPGMSDLQDPLDETKWRQLPTANDPGNNHSILEYKTQAEGVQTMLIKCSRYLPMSGGPILLSDLFTRHHLLMRAREADGGEVNNTDWMTDYETAGKFDQMMIRFYNAYYETKTVMYIEGGKTINPEVNSMIGFKRYPVPVEFGGGNINMYHHNFFADRLRAFGNANVHRFLLGIDWSDFQFGVIGTAQRNAQTNELDELYRDVIKINKSFHVHRSMTWAAILQDVNRHLMYRHFSNFQDDIRGTWPVVP